MALFNENNLVLSQSLAVRKALQKDANIELIAEQNGLDEDELRDAMKKANWSTLSFKYISENIPGSMADLALAYYVEKMNG